MRAPLCIAAVPSATPDVLPTALQAAPDRRRVTGHAPIPVGRHPDHFRSFTGSALQRVRDPERFDPSRIRSSHLAVDHCAGASRFIGGRRGPSPTRPRTYPGDRTLRGNQVLSRHPVIAPGTGPLAYTICVSQVRPDLATLYQGESGFARPLGL